MRTLLILVDGMRPDALENIETAQVFAKAGIEAWVCRNCGHVHIGSAAPEVCPVCYHPQAYFEVKANNF